MTMHSDRPLPATILQFIKKLSTSSLVKLSRMLAEDKDLTKIFSYVPRGTQIVHDPDDADDNSVNKTVATTSVVLTAVGLGGLEEVNRRHLIRESEMVDLWKNEIHTMQDQLGNAYIRIKDLVKENADLAQEHKLFTGGEEYGALDSFLGQSKEPIEFDPTAKEILYRGVDYDREPIEFDSSDPELAPPLSLDYTTGMPIKRGEKGKGRVRQKKHYKPDQAWGPQKKQHDE